MRTRSAAWGAAHPDAAITALAARYHAPELAVAPALAALAEDGASLRAAWPAAERDLVATFVRLLRDLEQETTDLADAPASVTAASRTTYGHLDRIAERLLTFEQAMADTTVGPDGRYTCACGACIAHPTRRVGPPPAPDPAPPGCTPLQRWLAPRRCAE